MAEKLKGGTVIFSQDICIKSSAGVAGHKEGEGPLASYFDRLYKDDLLGQKSWEKAESRLQTDVSSLALQKAGYNTTDIDVILAGDLLNQCISSTFGLRSLGIPYLGQYGACSTMAQGIATASFLLESGGFERAMAVTSSHFCSAERQFRLPIEYGGQRTPTAQWTVTGAGAAILEKGKGICQVKAVTVGRIIDYKIKDANNMGAAMAPAAADTLVRFFGDTGKRPTDFSLILTGDLGYIGSELLIKIMQEEGIDISSVHNDCGKLIFDRERQDVHAGGSGCGCCGSVFCSYIMEQFRQKKLNDMLFIATGALMSPTSAQQGESIPSIAHLIQLKAE